MFKKIIIVLSSVMLCISCSNIPVSPRTVYVDNYQSNSVICYLIISDDCTELLNTYDISELTSDLVKSYSDYSESATGYTSTSYSADRAIIYPSEIGDYNILIYSEQSDTWYQLDEMITVTTYALLGLEAAINPFSHIYLAFGDPEDDSSVYKDNTFVAVQ